MTALARALPAIALAAAVGSVAAPSGGSAPAFSAGQVLTVAIRTEDGVPLVGTLYLASKLPAPAVLLVHMQTRSRVDWRDLAERLAEGGISALAFDLRGHGASAPGPDGPGAAANMSPSVRDVQAAHAVLASRADVAAGRIGMCGASVGANLALAAAAADPTIRSLVLLSAGIDYRGIRGDTAMRRFGRRPALIVASLEDPYATRSARELAAIGAGACELRLLSGAGHGTTMLAREDGLSSAIVDWFLRTLL